MTRWKRCIIVVAVILVWSGVAGAWLRPQYEDASVVERSELILVGYLDKDSIKYVEHDNTGVGGTSWEHHATLVVTEVLKGTLKEKQIPIVINYGLDPHIGGQNLHPGKDGGVAAPVPGVPKDRIDIVDTADHFGAGLEDAQKDNLWFLRHLGGEYGREVGKGELGIADPEDVAAFKFKDYYKALLSKNADEQIDRLLVDPDEAVVARILRHLSAQHNALDTARIAKLLESPSAKVAALGAQALGEVADVSAVPLFRKALGHGNPEVRAAACLFLCRFRDTPSIAAIAKVLPDLDAAQRAGVIAQLPRMESREVVDLLLDQLDEHRDLKTRPWTNPYAISVAAAKALRTLTGIEFPLDTAAARRQWDTLKGFPDEVLLRKSMLEDIEGLTDKTNYESRSAAYETLGRIVNRHRGSYDDFHKDPGAREAAQDAWRSWGDKNITRPRTDWVYDGFAWSAIELPRPTDAKGIDTLIAVLAFYDDWNNRNKAPLRPIWSTDGGWVQANYHQYNANRLLEQLTGYTVGISPYEYDLRVNAQGVAARRWAAWWKENRAKVKIVPAPEEKPVTAEMLAKVPSLRLGPVPLSLTIRPKTEVHIAKGKEPFTILVEVKNTSAQDVVVEQRPFELLYSYGANGNSGSGGRGGGGHGGINKEDFVALKPGQTIAWEETNAPDVDHLVTPVPVENLQYVLTYYYAGSQFGLHAWRGKLFSNRVNCKVEEKRPGDAAP